MSGGLTVEGSDLRSKHVASHCWSSMVVGDTPHSTVLCYAEFEYRRQIKPRVSRIINVLLPSKDCDMP